MVSKEAKQAVLDALKTLEAYLRKGQWAVGENVTLADLSLLASVTTADVS